MKTLELDELSKGTENRNFHMVGVGGWWVNFLSLLQQGHVWVVDEGAGEGEAAQFAPHAAEVAQPRLLLGRDARAELLHLALPTADSRHHHQTALETRLNANVNYFAINSAISCKNCFLVCRQHYTDFV